MRPLLLILCSLVLAAGEPAIGSLPPELGSDSTFNTPDGKGVALPALKGSVVLIDFWATWCGPCVAAIPHVQKLHDEYKDKGLVVIGHTDGSSRDLPTFIKSKQITYIISVGKDIGTGWGVSGIPHVFLVDAEGKVAWSGHPGSLDDALVAKLVKSAKPPGPPAPRFEKAAAAPKVAKAEAAASAGKVGAAIKDLEKLAESKKEDESAAAKSALDVITAWRAGQDAEIDKLKTSGDVFAAWKQADALATAYSGHDDAKALKDLAAMLKKDPAYDAGKEYARLAAIPAAGRSDPRFAKQVDAFLKKWPDGWYAEQVKALK